MNLAVGPAARLALGVALVVLQSACEKRPAIVSEHMQKRATNLCRETLVDASPRHERHLSLSRSRVQALGNDQYDVRGILEGGGTKRYVECRVGEVGATLRVIAVTVTHW